MPIAVKAAAFALEPRRPSDHFARMALRDNFTAKLKCPECGRSGVVCLSQADSYEWMQGDRATTVDSMPEGFTRINRKTWLASDVDIVCSDHDVSALVKP